MGLVGLHLLERDKRLWSRRTVTNLGCLRMLMVCGEIRSAVARRMKKAKAMRMSWRKRTNIRRLQCRLLVLPRMSPLLSAWAGAGLCGATLAFVPFSSLSRDEVKRSSVAAPC